jgi:hypothetical protein
MGHALLERGAEIEAIGAGTEKPGTVGGILHGVREGQQFPVIVVYRRKQLGNSDADQTRGLGTHDGQAVLSAAIGTVMRADRPVMTRLYARVPDPDGHQGCFAAAGWARRHLPASAETQTLAAQAMLELQVSIREWLAAREEKMRSWLVLEEGFVEVRQVGVDVLILLPHGP